MRRNLFYALSPNLRFIARRLYYWPQDFLDELRGKRDKMTPPRGLIYTGSGDFKAQGQRILQNIITESELPKDAVVLDIGSGIGRLAVALTSYLNSEGYYEGFDVVKIGIEWCNKHITPYFPNFNFRHIDLKNDLYKASGAEATTFSFPYDSSTFDHTFLISVFTHMQPDEVAHYLIEINNVLKPGGKCFATFFTYDKNEPVFNNDSFLFPNDFGDYRLMDGKVRAANVAYDKAYLEKMAQDSGLKIIKFFDGFWNGKIPKEEAKDFQDIVIFQK